MPASPEDGAILARATVELFADAEAIILARVARRLALGLDSPSWAEQKLAEIQQLHNEIGRTLAELQGATPEQVRAAIDEAYRRGEAAARADLQAAGIDSLTGTNIGAATALAAETVARLSTTGMRILRSAEDAYREVIADTARSVTSGVLTRREAAQQALTRFAERGITGFVDSVGRGWDLTSYSEMALRTAAGRAAIDGHVRALSDAGHDLVIVSNSPGECKLCRPWEGKVLSLSGRDREHPSMSAARRGGLFHPNCRHRTGLYLPGTTPPMHGTEDPEGDAARQRLRELERQVRKAKRESAVAITPEAQALAQTKIRAAQARIREHVDETGLLRQRHREQLGEPGKGLQLPKPPPKPTAPPVPEWARGKVAEARTAFEKDGGFLHGLTDEKGGIHPDAWNGPGKRDGWVRMSGEPSERAYGHLNHLIAAGHDVEAEFERRSGGYFAKLDKLIARGDKEKIASEKARTTYMALLRKPGADPAEKAAAQERSSKASAKYLKTLKQYSEHRKALDVEGLVKMLGEIRGMGGKLKYTDAGGATKEVEDAASRYPTDWISGSNAADRKVMAELKKGRAYYLHSGRDGQSFMYTDGQTGTTIHELGHRMEHTRLDITKAEWAFYHRRTWGERAEKLGALTGDSGYADWEVARRDQFAELYMGKAYNGAAPNSAYELLTMGAQSLLGRSGQMDAEMRRWLLGTLALV